MEKTHRGAAAGREHRHARQQRRRPTAPNPVQPLGNLSVEPFLQLSAHLGTHVGAHFGNVSHFGQQNQKLRHGFGGRPGEGHFQKRIRISERNSGVISEMGWGVHPERGAWSLQLRSACTTATPACRGFRVEGDPAQPPGGRQAQPPRTLLAPRTPARRSLMQVLGPTCRHAAHDERIY